MEIQQRINQQRIQHIVDSYLLAGTQPNRFAAYLRELLSQYASGLIELALVETLAKSWLTIPMQKGVPFLSKVHERLKQWQQSDETDLSQIPLTSTLSPSQFSQITGLEAEIAFAALSQPVALPTPIND
ncbi:MAG: hypothetical protein AAFO06_24575 [Cyanobacteria bacterium J06597_16]